jgi:kumamolisin
MRIKSRIWSILIAVGLASGCSGRTPVPSTGPSARVAAAIDLGALAPDEELDVVVGLELPASARLAKFLHEQPLTGDALSPGDFADEFAVSPAQYRRVLAWLSASGLTITRTAAGRTTVSVHGSVAALERAFAAPLHRFEDAQGRFSAAVTELMIPAELGVALDGAVGLDGGLPWQPHLVRPEAPSPQAMPYLPADLEKLYNTAAVAQPGQGEQIVILGAGFAPAAVDLQAYFAQFKPYGLASVPGTYKVVQVGGANRDSKSSAINEQVENTLDAEMVSAIAPYADVVHVLAATNDPGLFTDGISYVVNQLKGAHTVSVSYGTCERGAASAMPVVHALLAQAKAQGQTWFFASGDTGSDGCRNGRSNTILSAGWPASAPWAIGVGGTQLDANGTEVVWNTNPGAPGVPAGGSGGGASETLVKPDYQAGVTPNDGARDEPDVAALAGPPDVEVYLSNFGLPNNLVPVGGTSAATPVWAGIWALLEQGKQHLLITNAHERIYALGKAGVGFHDIVSGNNGGPAGTADGGYPALPGYDLATGWGTPDTAALIASW